MEMEWIRYEGKVLAILLRDTPSTEGRHFVTPEDYILQLGVTKYPAGAHIVPHVHLESTKSSTSFLEFLHFEQGRAVLDLYTEEGKPFASREVKAGDAVLLVSGGHGLRVVEPLVICEIKPGPYLGRDKDKRMIDPERGCLV